MILGVVLVFVFHTLKRVEEFKLPPLCGSFTNNEACDFPFLDAVMTDVQKTNALPYLDMAIVQDSTISGDKALCNISKGCVLPRSKAAEMKVNCRDLGTTVKDTNDMQPEEKPLGADGCYIPFDGSDGVSGFLGSLDKIVQATNKEKMKIVEKERRTNSSLKTQVEQSSNRLDDAKDSVSSNQIQNEKLQYMKQWYNDTLVSVNKSIQDVTSKKQQLENDIKTQETDIPKLLVSSLARPVVTPSGLPIWQKAVKGKFFTLLYKYCNNGSWAPEWDPALLWYGYNGKLDMNVNEVQENPLLVYSRSAFYRNNVMMNEVFGKNALDEYDIYIEVYNSSPTSFKQIGWMMFKKPKGTGQADFDSWFSQNNYVDGTLDIGKNKTNYHIFSIRGHDSIKRRWFMSVKYNGCQQDPVSFVIPYGPACAWDYEQHGDIVMSTSSPFNMGTTTGDGFIGYPRDQIKSTMTGNLMLVFACKSSNDPYQNLTVVNFPKS